MAMLGIDGFDGVERLFSDFSRYAEGITIKAVEKAAPILEEEAGKSLQESTGKGKKRYSTGKTTRSFSHTKVKTNKWGTFTAVRPIGSDKKGVPYSDKAKWLEYGRYHRNNAGRKATLDENMIQEPRPWVQRAINRAQRKCEDAMQDAVFSEVDKLTRG